MSGTPANGSFDFEFALFDSLVSGSQLGSTISRNAVDVSNGVFAVKLDFGSQFPGASRFLEIRVRNAGAGPFTILSPRQQINSSPYSIKSTSAENAATATTAVNAIQLGGVAANQYVVTTDPRMTDARTPTSGSNNYIQNGMNQQIADFNIGGNGIDGANLGVGTSALAAKLSVSTNTNSVGTNTAYFSAPNIGPNTSHIHWGTTGDWYIRSAASSGKVILQDSGGNVGVGTSSPAGNFHINVPGSGNPISALTLDVGTFGTGTNAANSYFFKARDLGLGGTPAFLIRGDGNVGIGVSDPAFFLDVGQRMRIRSGGNNNVSAGLYFNNNANNIAAFVGMQDDTHVGLWGSGTGWQFGMNTATGALRVNGSDGQAGQVITSNGASPAQWKSPTNVLFQTTNLALDDGVISPGGNPTLVPGLTQTVNVAGNAKLLVHYGVRAIPGSCFGCGASTAEVSVYLDGTRAIRLFQDIANASESDISGSWLMLVGAGTHTVEIRGATFTGPTVNFGCGTNCAHRSKMILQVIPE